MKAIRRGPTAIVVAGLAGAAVVYALVSGSRPLYESQAVLVAPSPALLEQFDHAVAPKPGRPGIGDAALRSRHLGDVRSIAESVRRGLSLRKDGGALDISIDSSAGHAVVAARHHSPAISRDLAKGVADGIVGRRAALLSTRLAEARVELPLATTLATRSQSAAARARERVVRERIASLAQLRAGGSTGLSTLRGAAIPREPVAPRVLRDVIFAALLAMFAAITLRALSRAWASVPRRRTAL